jgi:truncated hemoglobin YjbI
MSNTIKQSFEKAKEFSHFDERYAPILPRLKDAVMQHQAEITDAFYEELSNDPVSAKIVEGRVDQLKATHKVWVEELFSGGYGDTYFERRYKIGEVHVKAKIEPYYVEVVTSFLRRAFAEKLAGEGPDAVQAALAILDLDAMVIIGAYHEDRMRRMSEVTGMNRGLLETLMSFG